MNEIALLLASFLIGAMISGVFVARYVNWDWARYAQDYRRKEHRGKLYSVNLEDDYV